MTDKQTTYHQSIELCGACDGKGHTTKDVMTCYHRREYDTEFHRCVRCGGSGRVECKVTTETWAYVPREVPS